MGDHLAVSPQYDRNSYTYRLFELISYLFDNTVELFWSFITNKGAVERLLSSRSVLTANQLIKLEEMLRSKGGLRVRSVNRNCDDTDNLLSSEGVKAEGEDRRLLKEKLHNAIKQFDAYDLLKQQVDSLRSEKYNNDNPEHERLLIELWNTMMPYEELESRIGKQWRHIGFQGDDPSTDFRGMGILSLKQLLFLAHNRPTVASSILSLSHHPTIGFPMAVAGITMTSLTRHLLEAGRLKRHFYNTLDNPVDMSAYNEAYCRIFELFVDYWKRANPPSVMHFNSVRMQFESSLAAHLSMDDANLFQLKVDHLSS